LSIVDCQLPIADCQLLILISLRSSGQAADRRLLTAN
jgi:hypothetical protein